MARIWRTRGCGRGVPRRSSCPTIPDFEAEGIGRQVVVPSVAEERHFARDQSWLLA